MEEDTGIAFVKSGVFHQVLKFFDPEEMLKLRHISTCMRDKVVKEIFSDVQIKLHENTFSEQIGANIQSAKKLVIETIQLTDKTS
jgi:hypothetical protein